jgi:hypothetical protein
MAKQTSALVDRVNDRMEVTFVRTRARPIETERNSRSTEEMEEDKLVPASFGINAFPLTQPPSAYTW